MCLEEAREDRSWPESQSGVFPPLYWVSQKGKIAKIAPTKRIQRDFNGIQSCLFCRGLNVLESFFLCALRAPTVTQRRINNPSMVREIRSDIACNRSEVTGTSVPDSVEIWGNYCANGIEAYEGLQSGKKNREFLGDAKLPISNSGSGQYSRAGQNEAERRRTVPRIFWRFYESFFFTMIPQELVNAIVDLVGDTESLKACSLASPSLCSASQRILLRSLTLKGRFDPSNYVATSTLFVESPHIAQYITNLKIELPHSRTALAGAHSIPEVLTKLSRVRQCTIEGLTREHCARWYELGEELTSAL
ncbi:hypothetical protein FB451DRAFT_1196718, partial [Mycena latifolia]